MIARPGTGAKPLRRIRAVSAAVVVPMMFAAGASGQELALQETPPPPVQMICAPPTVDDGRVPVDASVSAEVDRLVGAATQAMILGDFQGAREFLDRALRQDPDAAEAIYLRGRVLVEQDAWQAATESFCHYLHIDPGGPSAEEARLRLAEAVDRGTGADLYAHFEGGVESYRSGELEAAEAAFTAILEYRPGATAVLRNRAVVQSALGRSAAARADLERYLQLEPGPSAAERAEVEAMIAWLDSDVVVRSPGSALALGLVVPGGGQFYTKRPVLGTTMLGLAGIAAATGFLYKETTVLCRRPDSSDNCPPEEVAGRESERPWLGASIGVAAVLTIGAAIEAALHARSARRAPPGPGGDRSAESNGSRLELVRIGGERAIQLELVRIPVGGPAPSDRVR